MARTENNDYEILQQETPVLWEEIDKGTKSMYNGGSTYLLP
jgi:hypothetical protein